MITGSGGGGGCFAKDTLVLCPQGEVPIQNLREGDLVYSYDYAGLVREDVVTKTFIHENEDIYKVEYWGGVIYCTGNHWFLNQYNAFVEVQTMTTEDCIVDKMNHLRPLLNISKHSTGFVYNLTVENNHTFIADGIRVHNGGKGTVDIITGSKGGGGKGGGGAARAPVEAPDSLISQQFARVLDLLCEGEIEGLANGDKSIFLDDTPLQNDDGSYNFSDVTVDVRYGTIDQTFIPGFTDVESAFAVGLEITNANPVERQYTDEDLDFVRVTLAVPRLTTQDTSTGDLNGGTVDYTIELQSNGGGYTTVVTSSFNGKTTTTFKRAHDIQLLGSPPWDIRVSRVTPDNGTSTIVNDIFWDTETTIIDQKLRYPNSALVGIQIDSKQFNNIPSRAYDTKLLKIQIPTNYDPLTREYTGIWDGTFKTEWSDNPAWCFYDLVTNNRYGLGRYVPAEMIDKWQLFTVAQYCDEMISDGFGGLEPRFTCNVYLQTREEAFNVLQNMVSIFRGILYWSGGTIVAVQDSPVDPVNIFTNADVIEGEFVYQGSSSRTRHTVALVSWNDPNDRFKQKIEYVEDAASVALLGINETEVNAFGTTSRGQAHRMGKWILHSELNDTEVVIFKTAISGLEVRPGDVILTSDQFRAGVRHGGRVISSAPPATPTSVEIDLPVTIDNGISYTLYCTITDPTDVSANPALIVESRPVTNSSGAGQTIIAVDPQFSGPIDAESIWVLESDSVAPETWRVVSITEEGGEYTITALEHNPSKYAAIEDGLALEVKKSTIFRNTVDPVTDFSIEESFYQLADNSFGTKLHVGWVGPSDAARYEVSYRKDTGNFITKTTRQNQLEIFDLGAGDLTFKIVAYNGLGVSSPEAIFTTTTVGNIGPTIAPYDLVAATKINAIHVSWVNPVGPNFSLVELYSSATNDRNLATLIFSGVSNAYSDPVPGGNTQFYWIRSKSSSGQYSDFFPSGINNGIMGVSDEVSFDDIFTDIRNSQSETWRSGFEALDFSDWAGVNGTVTQSLDSHVGQFAGLFEPIGTGTTGIAVLDNAWIGVFATKHIQITVHAKSPIPNGTDSFSLIFQESGVGGDEHIFQALGDFQRCTFKHTVSGDPTSLALLVNADTTGAGRALLLDGVVITVIPEIVTSGNVSEYIDSLAIGEAYIADAAISSAKIQEAAIVSAHIGEAVIQGAHIGDASIGSAKIQDATITGAKIAEATIDALHLKEGAITNRTTGLIDLSATRSLAAWDTPLIDYKTEVGTNVFHVHFAKSSNCTSAGSLTVDMSTDVPGGSLSALSIDLVRVDLSGYTVIDTQDLFSVYSDNVPMDFSLAGLASPTASELGDDYTLRVNMEITKHIGIGNPSQYGYILTITDASFTAQSILS